jgi:uncharacterized phage protein (TIGR01671 family)
MEQNVREIKFRAWCPATKQVLPVTEIRFNNNAGHIATYGVGYGDTYTAEGDKVVYGGTTKESPLMQYIGLRDKNGKEIYEGDIVRVNNWKSGCECKHCGYKEDTSGIGKITWINFIKRPEKTPHFNAGDESGAVDKQCR